MTNKRVKIWNGRGGNRTVELTIGDDGFGILDDAARQAFTKGHCHSLALAIHQLTGWPIKGAGYNSYESPLHTLNYDPTSKRYVDVDGRSSRPGYGFKITHSRVRVQDVKTFDGYLKPDVKVALPFAKSLLRDLGIKVAA